MLPRLLTLSLIFTCLGDSDIYHGKKDGAKKPAEVKAQDVFNEIDEYKKIKDKGLTKDDAEYWTLLNKANEKFNKALKKVIDAEKHDCVSEKGKVTYDKGVTAVDITKKVIEALKK